MKNYFFLRLFFFLYAQEKVMAQNIQLHYDLGRALYKSLDDVRG